MQLKHEINGRVSEYWDIHKEIWENEFNNLDVDIAKNIMHDPRGDNAINFETRVERLVQEKIDSNIY